MALEKLQYGVIGPHAESDSSPVVKDESLSAQEDIIQVPARTKQPHSMEPSLGWNRLPLECLEIIVQVLDDDTTALASLLQVNRQCFFLVVPQLYKDPFQRLRDLTNRHSNRIRLCSSDKAPPTVLSPGSSPSDDPEETINEVARTRAKFSQDTEAISTIFTARLLDREFRLLTTLLSTLIQRLCDRFPQLHPYYFPPSRGSFDFGPFYQQVQWTSEYYLRHLSVLDLEKLSARGRRKGGPGHGTFLTSIKGRRDLVSTTGKEGVFQRQFSLPWWNPASRIGALDYLQRALLNIPGADRIQSLRIPAHRMKTFQKRQDRVPIAKSPPKDSTQHPECLLQEDITKPPELARQQRAVERTKSPIKNGTLSSEAAEESSRSYSFTFNKLTSLQRLEVCYVTWNNCDWETLERVLETLCSSSRLPGDEEGLGVAVPRNRIREFNIQAQSPLDCRFGKLLRHLEHLEVLEIQPRCTHQHICINDWDLEVCQNLKALRMGTSTVQESLETLGRLTSLEELRLTVDIPHPFQWVVSAKAEVHHQLQQKQQWINSPTQQMWLSDGNDVRANLLSKCLPKLRRLGLCVMSHSPLATIHNTCEAFADQLEELVIWAQFPTDHFSLQCSFRHLRRLAIRGHIILHMDFSSLVQQCPAVELLALQHTYFVAPTVERQDPDCGTMVAALKLLPKLRCLYLEGLWDLEDSHLLQLATHSSSLYKIGIHDCRGLTLDGCQQVDALLSQRQTKYPLKPKGLYRLPNVMSGFLARDFMWRIAFFGHEDD